jgi:hypothetical protein
LFLHGDLARQSPPVGWTSARSTRLDGSHWTRPAGLPPGTASADHAGPSYLRCLAARRRAESTKAEMRVASCSERSMPMAVPRCRPAGAHETHARDGFAHRELQPPDHTRPWWPLWRSYSSWPLFHAKLLIALPARSRERNLTMPTTAATLQRRRGKPLSIDAKRIQNRHESSAINEFSDGYGYDCFCTYCCCSMLFSSWAN